MNFKYFIFDYDGTLCDTHPAISHSIEKTFQLFGFPIPSKSEFIKAIGTGMGLNDTIASLIPPKIEINEEMTEDIINEYRSIYSSKGVNYATLFQGVNTLFELLSERQSTIIIVSNKGIKAVEQSLKKFNLSNSVSYLIAEGLFSKEKIKLKPDPMIFNEFILPKYPGINKSNTIVIGDTKADILFAKNCNVTSCWASYGYGNVQECQSQKPEISINTPLELLDYIDHENIEKL